MRSAEPTGGAAAAGLGTWTSRLLSMLFINLPTARGLRPSTIAQKVILRHRAGRPVQERAYTQSLGLRSDFPQVVVDAYVCHKLARGLTYQHVNRGDPC